MSAERESLRVRVHRDRVGYWAEVLEWPGCFASGRSWEELTEAIEEAVALWMTPDEQPEPLKIVVRIREIELSIDADLPLVRARAESSDRPLPPSQRSRDPHPDWPLRDFPKQDRR